MPHIPRRKKVDTPTRPLFEDCTVGPFEHDGLLLVRYPSNNPGFVAASLLINRYNTGQRYHFTYTRPEHLKLQVEFERALAQQDELHKRARQHVYREPVGVLALRNNVASATFELHGYGFSFQQETPAGDRVRLTTAIGNIVVDADYRGRGVGAAIAKGLIGSTPYVVDPNLVLHTLHEIDPPARGKVLPVWERPPHVVDGVHYDGTQRPIEPPQEYTRGGITVIRDLIRAYPDIPEYTVVNGLPQNP